MSGTEIPRDHDGHVLRPKPSQLLADVMEALGPDHLTTRTLMAALIERDRGVGVEPHAVSPVYGWHIPVLADAPNVPYDMQELALDIEGTLPGKKVRIHQASFTTDTNGVFTVPAATFGLTTLTGATVSAFWSVVFDGTYPHWASARISSNRVEVLVFTLASPGGTVTRFLSKSLTAYVVAWGT